MKWFYNMKIAVKLISAFTLLALIAGVVGFIGIVNIKAIEKSDTEMYENMTVPISDMGKIAESFQKVRVATRDIILANSPEDIKVQADIITQLRQEVTNSSNAFEKGIVTQEEREAFNSFLESRKGYGVHLDKLLLLTKENQDTEAFAMLNGDMKKTVQDEQVAIAKLVQLKVTGASNKSDINTAAANQATVTMIIIIFVAMVLAIGLGVLLSRIISNPIKEMVRVADQIADGNLDVALNFTGKDEVGKLADSFRIMTDNLNDVMSNINSAAEQVASGSKQVSDSSMALSQGATEQASSLEELTASMEEIATQTRQNAVNANEANDLSMGAKKDAIEGNSQMKEMLKAMEEINESSTSISKIIKVIDEIAFQTNILALNAAVEAARAGQHGKGFAVVAEEVRNLAARSANAAKETTAMIEGSIKKVEGGTRIANDTALALNKIVEGVSKATELVAQIATASNEQASGIAQVNQGIAQVSEVTQTNSATSEESAAASEELSSQAVLMNEQVSRFKLRRASNSKRYEDVTPEVMRLLENMTQNKKPAYGEAKKEAAATKVKIALSDREFGKY